MKEFIEKLISRLEELKTIELNTPCGCDDEETDDDGEQIFEDGRSQGKYEQTNIIIRLVKKLAEEFATETNVGNKDGWIPVSSGKLPEESGYYMACIYNSEIDDFDFRKIWFAHVDDYDMEESEWRELYGFESVTAWQPLPEPYRPSEELGEPKPCVNTACAYHKENADCEAAEGCAGYEPPAEPDWQKHMMNRFMREN